MAKATAFVVSLDGADFLVTNRHNLTGRKGPDDAPISPTGATPDELIVWQNETGNRGWWSPTTSPLYDDDGRPTWYEHSEWGRSVDVVVRPLVAQPPNVQLYPYPIDAPQQVQLRVASELHVVGFPFGLTAGGRIAVWTRGTIATEPDVDWDDLPRFLIDARTRTGQSGSPVIFDTSAGPYTTTTNETIVGASHTELVGIYSGRVNADSDLGIVWKRSIITDIIRNGIIPPAP